MECPAGLAPTAHVPFPTTDTSNPCVRGPVAHAAGWLPPTPGLTQPLLLGAPPAAASCDVTQSSPQERQAWNLLSLESKDPHAFLCGQTGQSNLRLPLRRMSWVPRATGA